jgi:hypothetical protein
VNDLLLARATFAATVKRLPGAKITLRNGARIIEKTWPVDPPTATKPSLNPTAHPEQGARVAAHRPASA